MNLCRFEFFDPVDEILSARLGAILHEPLYRARALLAPRTVEDIRAIAQALHEIGRSPDLVGRYPTEDGSKPMKVRLENGDVIEAWPAPDVITLLEANIDLIDLSAFKTPADLKRYELFAVVALTFIEQACADERRLEDETTPSWLRPNESLFAEHVERYGSMASRATSLAARLCTEDEARRKTASEGGKKRHISAKPLETAVLALYDAHYRHRSNRDAAARIYDELTRAGQLVSGSGNQIIFNGAVALNTDDPQKRFEKWIGDHVKASRL